MNIWSLLGVSVAVAALFSIGMNEMSRSQAFYETYRWYICSSFGWIGIIMFIVGRIRNTRKFKRLNAEYDRQRAESNTTSDAPERPFFFFNMAYWGVMLLIFAGIIAVIAPSYTPKIVEAAAPKPVPVKTVTKPSFDLSTLKLQGVVFRKTKPSVIIDKKTYFIGDKIEDAKVKTIEELRVILERNGEEYILKLERY